MVVSKSDEIVSYVNNGSDNNRATDKISSFYYIGHAKPGDLLVGYKGSGENFEPDDFNSSAFNSGCYVNLVGGCRTSEAGYFEDSNVKQFAEILDKESTILGSDVRVGYLGGVRKDEELINYKGTDGQEVKGNIVEKSGELPVK